jgi:glucose-6-phosphate 1-dehydrogenase
MGTTADELTAHAESQSAEAISPNLLRDLESAPRTAPPCAVVIFGASGDLTARKLMPAFYNLALANLLPPELAVVGVARHQMDDGRFRDTLRVAADQYSRTAPVSPAIWDSFAQGLSYVAGAYDDPATYDRLRQRLEQLDAERGTAGNVLFYMATPPSLFPVIVRRLGAAGLNAGRRPDAFARLVVEKPFGRDLASARDLSRCLWEAFREEQVFRIDHYLGKETVQNIFALRFANRLFEPVWNSQHVDHVQITVAESLGVENRGPYYEEAGAFRDMVENHMLQILAVVAMEPPSTFEADAVRDEKAKVLKALRPMKPRDVALAAVRGQYGPGWVDGGEVIGYRSELGVSPSSESETFVALRVLVDNWRWAGTPFYLRHGKRLPKRVTEVAVEFKPAPHLPFAASATAGLEPDILVLRIQPDDGITLRFGAKVPGPAMQLRSVNMDFLYGQSFAAESPDAYERLLLDALTGDHTLFIRDDGVQAGWAFSEPLLEAWRTAGPPLPYRAGTWGPDEADALLARDGRHWRRP